jgi:replicative DNA helicase
LSRRARAASWAIEMPPDWSIVGFFSLEMSAEQLATRIIAEQSGVASYKIRRGELGDRDAAGLVDVERDRLHLAGGVGDLVELLRADAKAYVGEKQADGTIETKNGGIVGFFSLEMSAEQLATRIIAEQSGVASYKRSRPRWRLSRRARAASWAIEMPPDWSM